MKGRGYQGEVTMDRYGRAVPKHAHGTANLEEYTASSKNVSAITFARSGSPGSSTVSAISPIFAALCGVGIIPSLSGIVCSSSP